MSSDASPLGPILREGRLAAGLTQEELASRLGVGQSTLSAYERGDSEPIWSTTVLIANVLELDIDELAAPFRTPKIRRPIRRPRPRRLRQVAS